MTPILALAGQFARNAVRERILVAVPMFLFASGFAAPLVSGLALGGADKALTDLGLGMLWIFGSFLAIYLGVRGIGADLRDGSAVLWLHRPLPRASWVVGRFLGVLAVLVAEVTLLLGTWAAVAAWYGAAPGPSVVVYGVLLAFELALVAAWGMLFSSLIAPVPAALATAGLWVAGHLADEYTRLAMSEGHPVVGALSRLLFLVVPDLDLFDVQDRVVHGLAIDAAATVSACGYGAAWTAALVALTGLVVQRRDVA